MYRSNLNRWRCFLNASYGFALATATLLALLPTAEAQVQIGNIALKASNGRYVYATNLGGSTVEVKGQAIGGWEPLGLFNVDNSGELWSGHRINLRAPNGRNFLQVQCGGSWNIWDNNCGIVNASTTNQLGWETFTIERIGGGRINHGDRVALRAFNGAYCTALQGGGDRLNCGSGQLLSWETFTIEWIGGAPSGGGGSGGSSGSFTRKYRDDFSGSWIDESIWNPDHGFQYENSYVTRDNVWVGNGALHLNFRNNNWNYTTSWASMSRGSAGKIRYGKVSARMRTDRAAGISVVALLWPTSDWEGSEIDFYEQWDQSGNRNPMYAVTHYPNHWGEEAHQAPSWASGDQWRTWTVEWTPSYISYQVDGVEYARVTDSWKIPNREMYVAFQIMVHPNNWPTASSATFAIDWVEVYSYNP